MNIKNWIIKKLGGYTSDEWDDENGHAYVTHQRMKELQRTRNASLTRMVHNLSTSKRESGAKKPR